ncbi:hypothetical protein CLCR_07589 [Cladophialophora carrionii]|uniref:N-acetyltransferase domain-containing protein n=1 Tax=Cladophialophora carrionii TaxID=86049 RepID=A0A1C1CPG4_9EURO|nr:hypothetical protein CLCR_07589 [Cladophialophora carrionii]
MSVVVVIDDELEDETVLEHEEGSTGTEQVSEKPRGRVIAAIKYYLVPEGGPHPDTGTQEVMDYPNLPVHGLTYENEALSNAFVGPMVAARKHAMKTLGPHMVIDVLYTDPAHQRRGAGGMLMRHACREADGLGLPTMLEASPAGVSVYEAVGFTKAEWPGAEIWIDIKRWDNGGDRGQEFENERLRADPGRKDGWDSGKVPGEAGDRDVIVV